MYCFVLLCNILIVTSLDPFNDTYSNLLQKKIIAALKIPSHKTNNILLCENYNREMNLSASVVPLRGMIGFGFDRLAGTSTAPVLEETFRFCDTTPDRRFFIPDNFTAEVIYHRAVDITSHEFHSYSDLSSFQKTDVSMSVQATAVEPLPPVTVGFSMDVSVTNSKGKIQKEDKSVLIMKVTNKMYMMRGNTAASMSAPFKKRLGVIAEEIKARNKIKAQYYIELLLLDYGTEVISEVLVGTKVDLNVVISSSMLDVSSMHAHEVKTTTSVGMAGITVDVGTSNGRNNTKRDKTESLSNNAQIYVKGGARLEFLQEENQTNFLREDTPVALARNMVPLYTLINNKMLESFNLSIGHISTIRHMVERATLYYFERNTIRGCTDKDAANFDFQANYDDNTCIEGNYCRTTLPIIHCNLNITKPKFKNDEAAFYDTLTLTDYTLCTKNQKLVRKGEFVYTKKCGSIPLEFKKSPIFGGMYQTCTVNPISKIYEKELELFNLNRPNPCSQFETKNIVTNNFSCPNGLHSKKIINFIYTVPDANFYVEQRNCDDYDPEKCHALKMEITLKEVVNITTYWCESVNDIANRIYYGGAFDRNQPNNFLGRPGCPNGFQDVHFFEQTVLCIEKTKSLKNLKIENMAELTRMFNETEYKNYCTDNQSKHLITVVNGLRIYGCINKKHAYRNLNLPAKISGPFIDRKRMFEKQASCLTVYINNELKHTITLAHVGHKFFTYFKNQIALIEESYKKKVSPQVDQRGFHGFLETNVIYIVLGALLLIIGIVTVVFTCK